MLHPETARDLMLAQAADAQRSATGAADADAVPVPAQLGWQGLERRRNATRGWLGQVVLSAFDIVTGLVLDNAVDIASSRR